MMNYAQAIDYLYAHVPAFHLVGSKAYKASLGGITTLTAALGYPQRQLTCVHVAGTNGKGSVSHLLAAVFQQSGYRTGLYTSPHLVDFRERIKINGALIPQEEVIDFMEWFRQENPSVNSAGGGLPGAANYSFFEVVTAMALRYFARQQVDVVVMETGLGGLYDSTNILEPNQVALSIITNIGLEHCALLGTTLPQIAAQKAGIIKPGVPVVIGEYHSETLPVFTATAQRLQSPLHLAWQEEGRAPLPSLKEELEQMDLRGVYQTLNLRTVRCALDVLRARGWHLPMDAQRYGEQHSAQLTGLRGRWERLGSHPTIVADTAHNAHGLRFLRQQLARERYQRLYIILGVAADKDLTTIVPLLPQEAYYLFTRAAIDRALPAEDLAHSCGAYGLRGETCPTVAQALARARALATPADFILIGGSNFIVGEALAGGPF